MPKKSRKYPTKNKTSTKKGKRDYMRQYMKNRRSYHKKIIEELRQDKKIMKELAEIPAAYELIFGKPKRKTKKKRHTK